MKALRSQRNIFELPPVESLIGLGKVSSLVLMRQRVDRETCSMAHISAIVMIDLPSQRLLTALLTLDGILDMDVSFFQVDTIDIANSMPEFRSGGGGDMFQRVSILK